MPEFENFYAFFLVPLAYVVTYTAGKYDVVGFFLDAFKTWYDSLDELDKEDTP